MPPNSISRTPVVRVISECEQKEINDTIEIRTDFVLQNIYSYLLKDVHKFEAVRAANVDEENFFNELIQIVDDFKSKNGDKIHLLCTTLNLSMDSIVSTLYGVANELFVEGYTWSRIIALFVFVYTVTVQCLERVSNENVVDIVYENFCRFVKENLKPWMDDHGGWHGVLCLKTEKPVGWTKNIWKSTGSMFGTLVEFSIFRC